MTTREEIEIRARDKSRAGFASVSDSLRRIGRHALNAKTAILGLAGVGGLGLLLKNSAENVDQVTKLADRLGIATDALAGIKLQAKLSGVEFATVTTGLRTVQYATYQATLGLQTYTRAFDALNLNAKDFARLSPDKQLRTLIDHLAKIPNITERNAVAYQIFGGRASQLLNLINDGTDALDRSTEQARAWGLALNRVDSAKIEMMNDAMTRAKAASEGLANTINVALAPYISALAEHFADAAEASNGFRDQVHSGMQIAAKAIGFAADAVHGLHVVWKGLELGIAKIIDFIIQRQNDLVQLTLGNYNKLAESSLGKRLGLPVVEFANTMDMVADVSANRVAEIAQELQALALQPMPSENVKAFFTEIAAKAEVAAKKIAESRAKLRGGGGDGEGLRVDNTAAEQLKIDELYRGRIAKIADSFRTENQVINDAYTQQRSIIEGANALKLLDDSRTKQLLEEAELQHQAKLGNIMAQATLARRAFEEQTARQKLSTVLSFGQQELAGVATVSKAIFKIQRAFTLANIAVSAPGAIAAAIERGGGLPWGAVFGALTAAKYVALASAAKSASFEGSTSAASIGGGTAAPVTPAAPAPAPGLTPAAPAVAQQKFIQISLVGNGRYSAQEVRDLIEQINEEAGDGVALLVT
jgi:hypothetical protein